MGKLTDLENEVLAVESKLLSAEYRNNRLTAELFIAIGKYKSEGGKKDLAEQILKGELLQRLATPKARMTYIQNMAMYSRACEIYFRFKRATKAYLGRKKGGMILLTEVIEYVCNSEKELMQAFNIKHSYRGMRDVEWYIQHDCGTIQKIYHIESISTVGENNIDDMYLDLAQRLTLTSLDPFMIDMLKNTN